MSAAASQPAPSAPSASEVQVVLAPRSQPSLALLLVLLLVTLAMAATEATTRAPEVVHREAGTVAAHHAGRVIDTPAEASGEEAPGTLRLTDAP